MHLFCFLGNTTGLVTKANDSYAQPSTSFEYSTSSIMTAVPVPVVGPSTSPHLTPAHSPALAASPGGHSQASITPPLTTLPSPIMHQMMQHSPKAINSETHGAEEETIIEKLDSLDLDLVAADLNMTQNLSASLFDSAPSITDTTYQDTSSANNQQQ